MNVAFIIFNRPELTACVFEKIAEARPDNLFIIADGPRNSKEYELCQKVRMIVEHIDWPCNVYRNYSDSNMGCRNRVVSGLDWVFLQVEDAIILEDDCLPDQTFFPFCCKLLDKYRNDDRVGHISGSRFNRGVSRYEYSYYFSKYTLIWGWATWRRAWNNYDVNMNIWPKVKASGLHFNFFFLREEGFNFEDIWDDVYSGHVDTWDMQWFFSCLCYGTLSIIPRLNMVSNIGCNSSGTHTLDSSDPLALLPTYSIDNPLKHPPIVVLDCEENIEDGKRSCFGRRNRRIILWKNLRNKHVYGSYIRKIPGIGCLWRKYRSALNIESQNQVCDDN